MSLKETDTKWLSHLYVIQLRTCWSSVQFCLIPGVDRKGQTKPYVLQICKKRSVIWGILKVLFFCYIFLKNYRQENRKNVTTSNFKLKHTLNHIVLSLLNSMTKTRKEHYFWYFFFKIKRKRTIIFKITLWNRPVSFPFRDMWTNNFLWYTRLWYRDRKW